MFPGMRQALVQLQSVEAVVKHVIVLTDGQTQAGDFENLTHAMRRANVTVSAIAVGNDADRNLLGKIAHQGGGKFYHALRSLLPADDQTSTIWWRPVSRTARYASS